MNNLRIHSVESEANKQEYKEFDNVDFLLNVGENRAYVKNSLRIVGDVEITSDGTTRTTGEIFFNRKVGAHAFIDALQVQFTEGPNAGTIENLQNYPRYVNMVETASKNSNDYMSGLEVCELKAPNNFIVEEYANGTAPTNSGASPISNANFSIKPLCCLNKMNNDLPFNRTGAIKITLNMARNLSALKGASQTATSDYKIKNLKITYFSVPLNPSMGPAMMNLVYNYKGSVLSNFSNISAKVPAVCSGVAVSFQEQRRENVVQEDNYEMAKINALDEVQFLFNDSSNEYITYKIDDRGEQIDKFIKSLSLSGHNQADASRLNGNDGFGLGLNFENLVSLTNNKFNLQLKSGVDGTNPLNAYLYFFSQVEV